MPALSRVATSVNGVMIAYAMGFVNAVLALVVSFGLSLTEQQQGAIVALVNALLILVAHSAYSNAKRTKTVIPSRPIDESTKPPAGEG